MIKVGVVAALTFAAGAGATVGSVVSSFAWTPACQPWAIYRDTSYVYAFLYDAAGPEYIRVYTTAGSFVRSEVLGGVAWPHDADDCHLGAGYIAIIDYSPTPKRLNLVNLASGKTVSSFAIAGPNGTWPAGLLWDGGYYFVGTADINNRGRFARYAANGSQAGTWTVGDWPANLTSLVALGFSEVANDTRGRFMVASSAAYSRPNLIVDMDQASTVASWTMPPYNGANGAVCGPPSRPAVYDVTYWANWNRDNVWYAYEFDIGGVKNPSVMPASLGNIRAMFR